MIIRQNHNNHDDNSEFSINICDHTSGEYYVLSPGCNVSQLDHSLLQLRGANLISRLRLDNSRFKLVPTITARGMEFSSQYWSCESSFGFFLQLCSVLLEPKISTLVTSTIGHQQPYISSPKLIHKFHPLLHQLLLSADNINLRGPRVSLIDRETNARSMK